MKTHLAAIVAAALLTSAAQLVDILDLTLPEGPDVDGPMVVENPSPQGGPPPTLAPTLEIATTNFDLWGSFRADVTLTNTGTAPIVIPWSRAAVPEGPGVRRLQGRIMIYGSNPGRSYHLVTFITYGIDTDPTTFRTVPPNARVVIQAGGIWQLYRDLLRDDFQSGKADFRVRADVMTKVGHSPWSNRVESPLLNVHIAKRSGAERD